MSQSLPAARRLLVMLTTMAMVCVGTLVSIALPASAVISPIQDRDSSIVTADSLPTAQINGVVWDQEIVGNTVYAGGNFSQARPAGAAAGVNQTPRSHLMAYSLSTGVMTSWNPGANAQIRTITSSPDGTRLYVGGDFTQINGQPRSRIAAFDTANGQLITSFSPPVGYHVYDIAASDTTVYVGGSFSSVGSQPRGNVAAFNASNGALLGWAPTTDRQVLTLDIADDASAVIIGGYFERVNGVTARGLAKLDATTGTLLPWSPVVSNGGADAAVNSLRVEGDAVFGTSFHFGPGGNMEGPWQLDLATGEAIWVADCHGDNYDAYPATTAVYTVGHPHYCGNTSLGFPQYATWRFQHSFAWTREATGTNIREVHGYANWNGTPSPSIVNWLPQMSVGSVTGQYQAGWTVEGNDDYVVIGGEFPRVNGGQQQGLTRFAVAPIAPENRGPQFTDAVFTPTLQAVAPGSVKVSWTAGFDMDDHNLEYRIIRTPGGQVGTVTARSTWWDTPGLAFVDTGLTPGGSYSYSLRAYDSAGNAVFGASRSIQVPQSFSRDAYGTAIMADSPTTYWPLNEPSGTATMADHAGAYPGIPGSAVTYGVAGAISGDGAVSVSNSTNGRIYAQPQSHAPSKYSSEVWFRTNASSGRLLGFGDLQTGNSGHRDRQIYLAGGRVNFGIQTNGTKVVSSPQTYNDNQWHQAVATLDGATARLYVDGVLAGQRHDVADPEVYVGHWRLGGDRQSGWPSAGNDNFTGSMDELAIYDYALTPQQVNAHYVASGRTSQLPDAPSDSYGQAVFDLQPDLYWRLSEATGTNANDAGMLNNDGTYRGTHTKNEAGALDGVTNPAVTFNGSSGYVSSNNTWTAPAVFSTEAWFKTTTSSGGKIIGFGNQPSQLSTNYDRHTFMQNDGTLVFGVYTGVENRVTSAESYNDGEWHHVVSSISPDGMKLYVDGTLVGSNPNTGAENFTGHWRVGGDSVWGGSSSNFLAGTIDEVAVYSTALTPQQVQTHYVLGSGKVPNTSPTAAFDFMVVNHLDVTFDGTDSSDADGTIAAYSWDLGDGGTATGATPAHTYGAGGTYTVTLTVTDDDSAQHSVSREVVVVPNEAPEAAFTHQVDNLLATFDAATSSDPDGTISTYTWDFGDDTGGSGVTPSHPYAAAGTYDVTLTVVDDDGASDTVTRPVTVTEAPPNVPPVAAFDATVTDLMVAVDAGDSSDADGTIVSYAWDFGDGGSAEGLTATHTYAAAGTYPVTLTATDDDGDAASVTQDVTVLAPPVNQAPTASFTVSPVDVTVTVDGSESSDTDGTIEAYSWSFGDGSSETGVTATHTYAGAGTYDITLTVTDDDGATDSTTQPVTVSAPPPNQVPEAAFTFTTAGLTATFDSSTATDVDGVIASHSWSFGDGSDADEANPTHTYAAAGTYDVTLTVADDDGDTDEVSHAVTVTAPPPGNEVPSADFEFTTSDLSAQFDGTGSSDSDGTIASWAWNFGDGAGGSGATVAHVYAVPGTYQVTLTVVDDDGATDSVTQPVTVSTPPAAQTYATDTFTRTVTNGFGEADLGGPWSTSNNASYFRVADGSGRITMASAGSGLTTGLNAVSAQDVETTADMSFDKPATGTGIYGTLMVRRDGGDSYRLRVRPLPGNTMVLLTRTVGGAETILSNATLPWVYQPGEVIRMRFTAEGEGTTALAGRVWRAADPEPTSWQVMANDSTPALQEAGSVALFMYLAGNATNAPVVATVDNLHVGGVGGAPAANVAPVAAFSAATDGLHVSVDAASSSDIDGDVEAFVWEFGDGGEATGETATHTYTAAGTYDVTLRVTDNGGATGSVTREVTVSEPGGNTPPVASFEADVDELSVTVDAGGSDDPDGTIAAYAWDFGDGTTATSVTTSHTYDEAGTYEVVLTVTDDEGAESSASREVSVSAPGTPGVIAADTFDRTQASGFGSSDVGGAWTPAGSATPFSVADGVAAIRMASPGSGPRIYLDGVSAADVDATVLVSLDKVPTGGDTYITLSTRRIGNSEYRLKARFMPSSTMVMLSRSVNGAETNLSVAALSGATYQAGDVFNLRFQATGTGTTNLAGKAWRQGGAEPAAWQVSATDSSAALQAPGAVGLQAYLSGSAGNAPVVALLDNLAVAAPAE